MINEAQRRALTALHNALKLCDEAGMTVSDVIGGVGVYDSDINLMLSSRSDLAVTDINQFLEAHPE